MYVGLPETSPAALEAVGPLGWALRAVQRVDASRPEFAEVLQRAAEAIRPLLGDEWRELASFLVLLAANRRPEAEFPEWWETLARAATDHGRRREFDMVGKSFAEATFDRGALKGQRVTILRMGRRRFGEPTPEQQARLEAIDAPERFDLLSDAIMDATSWDDLLGRA